MQHKTTRVFQSLIQKVKKYPKTSIFIGTTLCVILAIRKFQSKLLYLPKYQEVQQSPSSNPYPYRNPAEHTLPNYKNLEIKSSDGTILRGWYVSKKNHDSVTDKHKPQRLILYFHENAGNIGFRLPYIKSLVNLTNSDVMIVAYRGYSDSEGTPSQKGIKQDSIAIMNKALQYSQKYTLPLVIFGRSLGGAVAIYTCSKFKDNQNLKGLILQNTFTSIHDVVLDLSGKFRIILKFFLIFLLTNHWNSGQLIKQLNLPIMFIKSLRDQLIPIQHMNQLQRLNKSKNSLSYVIKNGTHNESWTIQPQIYFQKMNNFFSKL